MLNARQSRFVVEYCKDFDGSKAYVRAGYSPNGADQAVYRLLKDVEIVQAIEDEKEMRALVAGLTPEWVLQQWMQVASANPNDLVQVVCKPCRFCWAINDEHLPPNPECKQCDGDGVSFARVADTRSLKGPAAALYAGAVQTKEGVKVLMRDRDAALKNLADYLGMLNKSEGRLTGPGGGPLQVLHATPVELSDEQLAAIAGASMSNLGVSDGVSIPALPPPSTIEGSYEPIGLPE